MDLPDLNKASLEELARLHDWMVPPSRKAELEEYRRSLRRADLKAVDQAHKAALRANTKPGDAYLNDPRGFIPQREELSQSHATGGSSGIYGLTSKNGAVRYGPKGGRYEDRVTKDGRRYRRYF